MKNKGRIKFVIILVVCFLLGFISTFCISLLSDMNIDLSIPESELTALIISIVVILVNIAVLIILPVQYTSCTRLYKRIKETQDEELIDKLEFILNYPLSVSSISSIINRTFSLLLAFSVFYYFDDISSLSIALLIAAFVLAIVTIFITAFLTNKLTKMIKELNPEKKGDTYSTSFSKEWLNSCDEAEKLDIYKSGWYSFKNTVIIGDVLLFLALFYGMITEEIAPMIFVSAFIAVLYITYIIAGIKEEKKKR